jgi:Cytochrome C oxidase, cbb3-type, subunit III
MICCGGRLRFPASPIAALMGVAVTMTAFLAAMPAPLAQDVARGQKIWTAKAGCPECHGWAGDGVGAFHSEGRAPALRETELTRDQIRETIQCGRPGTPMPHFDRFAYTDKRCYGLTADDLGDLKPNRAPTTLQPDEVDALADYVAAKLKGGGRVTRAQCLEYFGGAGSRCSNYPER